MDYAKTQIFKSISSFLGRVAVAHEIHSASIVSNDEELTVELHQPHLASIYSYIFGFVNSASNENDGTPLMFGGKARAVKKRKEGRSSLE
jgi:hypothetical protein